MSAPAVTLPRGGGAIRGIGEKFTTNPATGTGSLTIPIPVSAGRSGFGPELSLTYDSGAGNGPFGFGWTLSIPAITRKTDKGLPQYDDPAESDVYLLSATEDLVPVLKSDGGRFEDPDTAPGFVIHRYRPRTEGSFVRIERWTERAHGVVHWRSITRDNVTTVYGRTEDSRIVDPDDPDPAHPTRIFTWLICESYDDKGNAIVYTYAPEDDAGVDLTLASEQRRRRGANRYVKRITYGNRTSRVLPPDPSRAEWLFEVVFDYDEGHYEELDPDPAVAADAQHRSVRASHAAPRPWSARPDPFSSYRAGFEVRAHRRCRRILTFHRFAELGIVDPTLHAPAPCLVRATEIDYGDLDYARPHDVDEELAHAGSTRLGSFIRAVTQSGYVRDAARDPVERDGVVFFTYRKKSLPPLELEYSSAAIRDELAALAGDSVENLPVGLDGAAYRWVDLDGEGVAGVLTEQAEAWFYKSNLGGGRLGPSRTVARKPSLATLGAGGHQLLDLAGDGQLDVVAFGGPTPGFSERGEEDWEPFRSFERLPNVAWDDPNLRFVDLDGDGHADILVTEHDVFTWHASLGEEGFGEARHVYLPADEDRGPRLLLGDRTQSIHLADMSGDGLSDLVRIRNGEICYWPNLGYGRFGAKVSMDDAPWFDAPDQFDGLARPPRRHRRLGNDGRRLPRRRRGAALFQSIGKPLEPTPPPPFSSGRGRRVRRHHRRPAGHRDRVRRVVVGGRRRGTGAAALRRCDGWHQAAPARTDHQ